MDLRMKNFNIMEVHWKIQLLEGVHKKQIYRGELPKMGHWTVCEFNWGLGKKGGVDTPMHTMPRFLSWPTRPRKITNFLQVALFWKCFLPQQRGVVWELRKTLQQQCQHPHTICYNPDTLISMQPNSQTSNNLNDAIYRTNKPSLETHYYYK